MQDSSSLALDPEVIQEAFRNLDAGIQVEDLESWTAAFLEQSCRQFVKCTLPLSHCLDTYHLIRRYVASFKQAGVTKLRIDPLATSLVALLHHLNADRFKELVTGDHPYRETTAAFLEYYRLFLEGPFRSFLERKDEVLPDGVDLAKPLSDQEEKYLQLMKSFIDDQVDGEPQYFAEFVTLLFFDTYSGLLALDLETPATGTVRSAAYFSLTILPELVGPHGFGDYARELADYAFSILEPELYQKLASQIQQALPSQEFREEVAKGVLEIVSAFPRKVLVLDRQKTVFSTLNKAQNYRLPVHELWDLYGFRLIVESEQVEDCYRLLSHIDARWKRWEDEKAYADYIQSPKPNGYRSLHAVIEGSGGDLVEFQIRTAEMDFVAEYGTASHFRYKRSGRDVGGGSTPMAVEGRRILEKVLASRGLSVNSFVKLLAPNLAYVPLDHYLEGIASGRYDIATLLKRIETEGEGS